MSDQNTSEAGIDWDSLLNICIKRRTLVLKVFCIMLSLSAVLGLVLPKMYQATALVLISPSRIDFMLDSKNLVLEASADPKAGVKEMFLKPTISLATHKTLLQSGEVMGKVISRLDLKKANGLPWSPDDLLKKIAVGQEKSSGLFQLFVQDKDPTFAMQMVNIWAEEYIKYTRDLIFGEIKGTSDFVGEQFEIAKKNFMDIEQKSAQWRYQFPLDLMQDELRMKKVKLNNYKADLYTIAPRITASENLLKELQNALAKQDKFIITSAVATDDVPSQPKKKMKDLNQIKTSTEAVNPIYQDLQTRVVKEEMDLNVNKLRSGQLQGLVEGTQKDINELLKVINEKQLEYDELMRREATYKKTYDNLSSKIEDARITKAAQLGEVKLVSLAYLPDHPVGLGALLIIMMGGVLGLFMGVVSAAGVERVARLSGSAK